MLNRLGALDAAWLHMERPTNPMMITGVLWFDEPLPDHVLVPILRERLLERYPRFTHRIVDAAMPLGARWEVDPGFHLDNHLHRIALPGPGGRSELQALVSDLASTPLDLRRSPWQFHIVEQVDGGSALVARIHHSMADGIALARVLMGLTDGTGELEEEHPAVVRKSWTALPLALAEAAVEGVNALAESLLHPDQLLAALDLGEAAAAEVEYLLRLAPDPLTRLRNPLVTRKVCAWSEPIPLERAKSMSHALGVTINDVLVSAMAGAIGEHLRIHGDDPEQIRAFVPVNVRPLDQPIPTELGNEFALVVLALPVGERDPVARLLAVHDEMERLKQSIEPALTYAMFKVLGAAPARLEEWIVEFFGHKGSAVFTNVPGPRKRMHLGGIAVRGAMCWVPQSGPIGLGLSIFSYAGEIRVGVAADANGLPDPQGLADRFADAFEELCVRTGL